jgi:hypothetical protein
MVAAQRFWFSSPQVALEGDGMSEKVWGAGILSARRDVAVGAMRISHRLDWDYHKTLDDLHQWIKEMPSIPEGTTIEWTLGDDDMRVGYIGDYIVVMRAFELPPR